MSNLDDIQSGFRDRIDRQISTSHTRLERDLDNLRQALRRGSKPAPHNLGGYLSELSDDLTSRLSKHSSPQVSAQLRVELDGTAVLDRLDTAFMGAFKLVEHYPHEQMTFPTIYCETLEEFFTPLTTFLDLSSQARQAFLEEQVRQAEEQAESTGGGTFGYNLPGHGCYLNGWLFVYRQNLTPRDAFREPRIFRRILETTVHEKFGHGFLSTYSALGRIKSGLGLEQVELARRFGLRAADDPVSSLRREQANLVFNVSQLLEEGWSTWIETYLKAPGLNDNGSEPVHPRHSLGAIVKAIKDMDQFSPDELPGGAGDISQVQQALMTALAVLFNPDGVSPNYLHQAVMMIDNLGSLFDDYFGQALRQPLRYAVGELLYAQAEANAGGFCMPYLALIAANVTYDFERISLADLTRLLEREMRLHPDARLASLSRVRLQERGSLAELVQHAEGELSFSIPPELKPG